MHGRKNGNINQWTIFLKSPTKQSVDISVMVIVIKSGSKKGYNKLLTIAFFFYQHYRFQFYMCMIEESMRFAKQNPFQSYKAPSANDMEGSLTKHVSEVSKLQL